MSLAEEMAVIRNFTRVYNKFTWVYKNRYLFSEDELGLALTGAEVTVLLELARMENTTAKDLARIMKYCITESPAKEQFLEITRTDSYSFSDCNGDRTYTCTNHNAFLKMMDGALTGKTGFTADAGYCYVGALKNDDRTFIVALLACGWPNNKGYKWSDTRKLMTYGIENYSYREIDPFFGQDISALTVDIENGYTEGFPQSSPVKIGLTSNGEPVRVLLKHDEEIESELDLMDDISAPLQEGQQIGEITYSVNGSRIVSYPLYTDKTVVERTFKICLYYIRDLFFLNADIKINQHK